MPLKRRSLVTSVALNSGEVYTLGHADGIKLISWKPQFSVTIEFNDNNEFLYIPMHNVLFIRYVAGELIDFDITRGDQSANLNF